MCITLEWIIILKVFSDGSNFVHDVNGFVYDLCQNIKKTFFASLVPGKMS